MNTIVQPGGLPDSRLPAARAQEGSMVELSCATTITRPRRLGRETGDAHAGLAMRPVPSGRNMCRQLARLLCTRT